LRPTSSRRAPAPTSPPAPSPPSLGRRLSRADLPVETVALARALIGKLLVHEHQGEALAGRIVETEAYVPGDAASHSYRGMTRRNRTMFGPHLTVYVYFIYGANWCMNISSEGEGIGAAVLIRACEPVAGIATMRALRGRPGIKDRELLRGPGNLCRALAIGPAHDGLDLDEDPALWLADDGARLALGESVRIGITRAVETPHRYYARGNRSVSGPRALSP
jgi:DNA-3-methyladenine glycosylase